MLFIGIFYRIYFLFVFCSLLTEKRWKHFYFSFHGWGWTTFIFCDQPYILHTWCPLTFFSGLLAAQGLIPLSLFILFSLMSLWCHCNLKCNYHDYTLRAKHGGWSVIHTPAYFNWIFLNVTTVCLEKVLHIVGKCVPERSLLLLRHGSFPSKINKQNMIMIQVWIVWSCLVKQ